MKHVRFLFKTISITYLLIPVNTCCYKWIPNTCWYLPCLYLLIEPVNICFNWLLKSYLTGIGLAFSAGLCVCNSSNTTNPVQPDFRTQTWTLRKEKTLWRNTMPLILKGIGEVYDRNCSICTDAIRITISVEITYSFFLIRFQERK